MESVSHNIKQACDISQLMKSKDWIKHELCSDFSFFFF